jgi:hypothetical protein
MTAVAAATVAIFMKRIILSLKSADLSPAAWLLVQTPNLQAIAVCPCPIRTHI